MKKTILILSNLLIISFLLNSCSVDRSIAQRISSFENIPDNNQDVYVQYNDGSIKHFKSLELVTGVFTSPHLLADNNIKINASEIKAYQDKTSFAISQKTFVSGIRSAVALDALPGFAVRVIKGKVNVYCKKFFNGAHAADEYYLQFGDKGEIRVYSPELMNSLLKNDLAAYDYFNSKSNKNKMPEKLIETIKILNNGQIASNN